MLKEFAPNGRCERLRVALCRKVVADEYDAAFIGMLEEFNPLNRDDPATYFWLAGRCALHCGDASLAVDLARRALGHRPCSLPVMLLLAEALDAAGKGVEAVRYKVVCASHLKQAVAIPEAGTPEGRRELHWGMSLATESLLYRDCVDDDANRIYGGGYYQAVLGDFLLYQPRTVRDGFRYWVGLRNENSIYNEEAHRVGLINATKGSNPYLWDNVWFDVRRAQLRQDLPLQAPPTADVVVPLAGSKDTPSVRDSQLVAILRPDGSGCRRALGQYEFTYLRLKRGETVTLHSSEPMAVAPPIVMRHSPRRRKLVLNLFLDGLSWSAMRQDGFRHVPNLVRFFSKGVIFNNAYSVAEYTFPALSATATGLYMHHSHATAGRFMVNELPPDIVTISEQMKSLGYHCVNTCGCGRGLGNGASRGFDRLTVRPYFFNHAYLGVKFTLDHLHEFAECDNYVFAQMDESHMYSMQNVRKGDRMWVRHPWDEMCELVSREGSGMFGIPGDPLRVEDNLYQIARMDEALAPLLDYIERNYRDDEFIVNAFSDHGVSAYDDDKFYLKDTQSSIAMMCRGAGVPRVGFVDELVSAVDLYAIMAREAGFAVPEYNHDTNLPAAFGGKEREIVFSNSIYAGQTYKLAMRTKDYECRLESKAFTRCDCTIDLDGCDITVCVRDGSHRKVDDAAVREYFVKQAAEFTRTFRRAPLPKDLDDKLHFDLDEDWG